jgi:hypothetical protein
VRVLIGFGTLQAVRFGARHPKKLPFKDANLRLNGAGFAAKGTDYRHDGAERHQIMTLTADEFIRRFLLHVLPRGFHRIRHYGLLASAARRDNLALARRLLAVPSEPEAPTPDAPLDTCSPCPCCGGRTVVIETFARLCQPRAPPPLLLPIRELAS